MAARKSNTFKVVGGAVVLKVKGGSERYLYRGDVITRDAVDADSLEHALGVGLLAEVKETAAAATDKSAEKDADASADAE